MDNLEVLKAILSEYVAEDDMQKYLEQLDKPLSQIESKWTPYIPKFIQDQWDTLDPKLRCAFQLMGIRVADLETVAHDYREHFLGD